VARETPVSQLAKGSRITGPERGTLTAQFAERYAAGESIRSLAAGAGRSYGFVHNLLTEAGASLRGRGGATRGTAKAAAGDDRSTAGESAKDSKRGKKGTRKKS
jgi:hypothetical protein